MVKVIRQIVRLREVSRKELLVGLHDAHARPVRQHQQPVRSSLAVLVNRYHPCLSLSRYGDPFEYELTHSHLALPIFDTNLADFP